jgi:hypothetical protein
MSSLGYFLDRIDKSVDALLLLEFLAPGMFTNAIINKPKINKLLKDVEGDETSLFKVVPGTNYQEAAFGTTRIVRTDGRSIYNEPHGGCKSIVPILLLKQGYEDQDDKKHHNDILIDDDVDLLCAEVYSIIDKYPNLIDNYAEVKHDVTSSQNQYHQLKHEIHQLQQSINDQKQSLMDINNDYSPSKRSKYISDESLEEAIAKEEEEIKRLEHLLNVAQD